MTGPHASLGQMVKELWAPAGQGGKHYGLVVVCQSQASMMPLWK